MKTDKENQADAPKTDFLILTEGIEAWKPFHEFLGLLPVNHALFIGYKNHFWDRLREDSDDDDLANVGTFIHSVILQKQDLANNQPEKFINLYMIPALESLPKVAGSAFSEYLAENFGYREQERINKFYPKR